MEFSLKLFELRKVVKTFRLIIAHDANYILKFIKLIPTGINKLLVIGNEGLTEIQLTVEANIQTLSSMLFKFEDVEEALSCLQNYKNNTQVTFTSSKNTAGLCDVKVQEDYITCIRITNLIAHYPDALNINSNISFNIESQQLQEVFERVAKISSKEPTKHILTGIHFRSQDNNIEWVAIDGHRLNRVTYSNFTFNSLKEFTIKFKTLSLVSHLMKGLVKVSLSDDKEYIVFEDDNTKITSFVQLGEYPDYSSLIPNYLDTSRLVVTFDKKTLLWNIKTAVEDNLVILEVNNKITDLKITDIKNTKIVLYHNVIDCKSIISHKVAFKAQYFKEAVQNINSDKITISLDQNNTKGTLINQDKLTQLLMPIKLYR